MPSKSKLSSDSVANFNTLEDADPFSLRNLKRSSGTSGSTKSVPKITLTGVKSAGGENLTSSNSRTGISIDSQSGFNNVATSISADDLNEIQLLDTYDETNKSTTSLNRIKNTGASGNQFISNMDIQSDDISFQNVESRFPEINLNHDDSRQGQSSGSKNDFDTPINTTGNVLQVKTGHAYTNSNNNLGDVRRSKSMKADGGSRKRFSVNNPFPTLNKVEPERTGDSIISFEDIKDNLVKIDTNQPSIQEGDLSRIDPVGSRPDHNTNNKKSESGGNTLNVSRGHTINVNPSASAQTSRSALNLPGGYRRLSSEQLAEQIIDFSDEDSL